MLHSLVALFINQRLFFAELIYEHLFISLTSVMLAIVLGLITGILISEYQKTSSVALGVINFIYTIPSISLLGFLIPLSGIGNTTAIIALTVYALLPMVRNTYTGLSSVDPLIIESARGMGMTRWQILRGVRLPMSLPIIISGIRNMTTMTVALTGIASFIGAGGLGVAIYRGITTNNQVMTVAGSLLIALLALFLDFLGGLVEKALLRKRARVYRPDHRQKKYTLIILALSLFLVCAAGFLLSQHQDDKIQVATKPMTEQYILGNMIKLLVEQDTDLKVNLTTGVGGGTSNIHPGLLAGEFDLYPEYTGTGWNIVLKHSDIYDESKFERLKQDYLEKYDLVWTGRYGFENTYCFLVDRRIAEKYGLKTISDLAAVSQNLRFGGEYDFFDREDGLLGLEKAYGLRFGSLADMDIGLKYEALKNHEVDVTIGFTTDGQLASADAVILEDDKGFYSSYACGNIVREEVINKHPELRKVLEKFNGTITNQDMAKMNDRVEVGKEDPRDVARDYLVKKHLLTD